MAMNVDEEFRFLSTFKSISTSELEKCYRSYVLHFEKTLEMMKSIPNGDSSGCNSHFIGSSDEWHNQHRMKKIQHDLQLAGQRLSHWKEESNHVIEYFGELPSTSIEELFAVLDEFFGNFRRAKQKK